MWLLSLGTSDMEYPQASARTTGGHLYVAPDLFTPETPMVTYQGMTDPVILLRTPGCLRTVLVSPARANPKWPPACSIIGGSSPSEKSYPENTTTHGLKRYISGQGRCFFGMSKRPNALVGFDATMNPRGAQQLAV